MPYLSVFPVENLSTYFHNKTSDLTGAVLLHTVVHRVQTYLLTYLLIYLSYGCCGRGQEHAAVWSRNSSSALFKPAQMSDLHSSAPGYQHELGKHSRFSIRAEGHPI